jgi:hypothetical protein
VVIRRDTTGPVITMFTPAPTLYTAGTTVTPAFTCSDANGYSGVASCAISEGSTPLSMTPGWHGFTVTATDRAGNLATKRVEYFASTGTCVPANVNLKALWRFENDATDQLTASSATPTPAGTLQFAPGIAGRSWQSQSTTYLDTHDGERLLATDVLTVAAWLKVNGQFGESATIVSKPAQYRIARYFDGTLRWAFNQDGVLAWVNTGVVIPGNVWTHVAVVYDHGLVKTYMNGRLAHAQQLTGTLTVGPNPSASMTIGGRADLVAFYFGWLDELQVATAALSATEIEAMALAGSGTLCPRGATTMTVSVPFSVGYGSPFTPTATLRNSAGLPLAGKLVTIKSYVSPTGSYVGEASGTTDSAGQIQVPVPMSPAATVRVYSPGVTAQFTGDGRDGPSTAMSNVLVLKGTPAITWPSPSSIVYGTALGAAQLAASANTSGTFTYTPGSGTVLAAGTRTLGVTFTPSDTDRWNAATATTALLVNKAAPVVTIGGGPFTFDGQGHPAAVTVLGVGGDPLSPYSVLYDGASDAPVQGGSHAVTASYSGDANYEAATGGGTLVINKATPIMSLVDVSLTYNGHPQGVAVKVAGVNNEALTPVAVTYNGSTTPPADTGTYTIDARYDGNGNYNAVSGTATLRILKAPAQLTWATPASIVYGTPVGPVQLNATANVPGTFSYAYGPTVFLVPGTHPLSVTFTPADAANYNGASAATTLTVTRAPLTITATSWTKPYGAPLPPFSVTASGFVYPDSLATLAGALSFATAATATSAVGTYPVTPQGVSSPNYAIAFVAGTLTVVPGMTATSLVASPNPSGLNQPVTLTATVSVMAGAGVPGGSVQFFDGGTLLGTAPLAGATAALTTNGFVPGSHTLSAAYSGDARFAGSAQGSSLTVRPGATSSTTSVTSSANPSSVGQSVALTANVVAPGTSTGSVAFYDGAVLLGTVAVSSNETARLTTSALAAGGHAITARYLGDASTTPSVSPAFAQYVRTSGNPRTSSVVVAAAPSPAALGALVTLTATVSGTQNQRPTGTVIFFVNGSVAGEGTLSPAGPVTARAVLSTSTLPHGSHRVDAVYLGDGTYRASTTAITVVVN